MKKFLCGLLSAAMLLTSVSPVFAEETIVIVDDSNKSAEENKEETKEETKVEEIVKESAEITPLTTFVALGSDLTAEQQATVLTHMGLTPEKLQDCNVVYVSNSEEHSYLDSYIDPSLIGKRSLSSVLVRPASTGHGVTVKTVNVNYCTETMYQNALITAGVTDAEVLVVAPSPISGTAGLIGALKAYSQMSGEPLNEKALDTALDELVTTGEVKDAIGDDEKAEELISYVKAQVAANDLNTKEEIEAAVRKGNKELNANLTEEQIQQIVEVMVKIKAMGIDFEVLADQAEAIYAKYGDQIKAGTFNIDDVDLKDLGIGKMAANAIGNFFTKAREAARSFFGTLFGKKK